MNRFIFGVLSTLAVLVSDGFGLKLRHIAEVRQPQREGDVPAGVLEFLDQKRKRLIFK